MKLLRGSAAGGKASPAAGCRSVASCPIWKNIGSWVIIFFLLPAVAFCSGQSPDQGFISGTILTAAGAGATIPGALVDARNPDTKASYKATSSADGSYELSMLPTGTYEISIENMFPFLPFHQSGVQVSAGRTTRLDIRLKDFNLETLGDGGEQFAQLLKERPAPSGPAPRTGDGRPDLSGVWEVATPKMLGEGPQPLPEAEAAAKQRGKRGRLADLGPGACLPGGVSLAVFDEYRIVQTATLIVLLDGGFNPDRQIYLDGREHPKEFNPSWMGHSIGHWEGDTLVVDTVGFNDLGWIAVGSGPNAVQQTEKLRVTERFRRLDLGHLEVVRTYDDPGAFKQPVTTREVRSLAPKDREILEYVCAENNRDLPHFVNSQGVN